jgi:DNA topoisomerase I
MVKPLIIVESPAKIKTLKKFLGEKYFFESSVGHIRDLPAKEFGIDVEHDFEPTYENLPDKSSVIQKLKKAAKEADVVYLCPDPDREGEAIAWHIAAILPKGIKYKRITFNSITKDVVREALLHPRDIDIALVNAQQARRLLDRIVGYKISPILTQKIKKGKSGSSAGRVQSVALKFVVDREKEIENFTPIEYWNIGAIVEPKEEKKKFEASIYSIDGKKVEKEAKDKKDVYLISNKETAEKIVQRLKKASYTVKSVEKKEKKRHPTPPFITSTLQQEASRHYGFAVSRTMGIAQSLYEGVDLKDEGIEGLITYMRTDSVNVSQEAITLSRDYISKKYGKEFLPEKPRVYTSKKSAQEAHEAIRPTNLIEREPDKIKKYLTLDQYKIYLLIWNRFIASQMESAIYDTVSVDIEADSMILRATGSVVKFQGFLAAYEEKHDPQEEDEQSKKLPTLKEGEKLTLLDILYSQSFTKPPPRYTEASLVKELEKSGIGRPSTYAAIMNKILSREYTTKMGTSLKPTELGKVIAQMIEDNFPPIMNIGFTSAMEDDLELVAENKRDWKGVIKEFYEAFMPMVEKAKKEAIVPKIDTNIKCPKCGKHLQKIWSVDKYFYGCSNYPDCDFTSTIEAFDFDKKDYAEDFDWDQKCPICKGEMVIRHGKFGPFLGCKRYPECKGIINIPKKGEAFLKEEDRPACPALGCDGKILMRRSRFGKIFYSCSNFPACDVIVNSLDDLDSKYDAKHPKTAYVKKEKRWKKRGKETAKSKKEPVTKKKPSEKKAPVKKKVSKKGSKK